MLRIMLSVKTYIKRKSFAYICNILHIYARRKKKIKSYIILQIKQANTEEQKEAKREITIGFNRLNFLPEK